MTVRLLYGFQTFYFNTVDLSNIIYNCYKYNFKFKDLSTKIFVEMFLISLYYKVDLIIIIMGHKYMFPNEDIL